MKGAIDMQCAISLVSLEELEIKMSLDASTSLSTEIEAQHMSNNFTILLDTRFGPLPSSHHEWT